MGDRIGGREGEYRVLDAWYSVDGDGGTVGAFFTASTHGIHVYVFGFFLCFIEQHGVLGVFLGFFHGNFKQRKNIKGQGVPPPANAASCPKYSIPQAYDKREERRKKKKEDWGDTSMQQASHYGVEATL